MRFLRKLLIDPVSEAPDLATEYPLWVGCYVGLGIDPHPSVMERCKESNSERDNHAEMLIAYIRRVLVPEWSQRLNERHHVDYSEHYWAVLLTPWLWAVTTLAWRHYLRVRSVIASKESFYVTLVDAEAWTFKDTFALFHNGGLNHPDFHAWVISEYLRAMMSRDWKVESRKAEQLPDSNPKFKASIPDYRYRECMSVFGMSDWKQKRLSKVLAKKEAKEPAKPGTRHVLAPTLPAAFTRTLDQLLEATLPLSFSDNFPHFDKRATKKTYRPGAYRVFGPVLMQHEPLKFNAAHSVEQGEYLITTQHGGSYGQIRQHSEPELVEYPYHAFISWGWSNSSYGKPRTIPLPSPFLATFRDKHKPKSKDIVLVGTDMSPFRAFHFDSAPSDSRLVEYRQQKLRFIKKLKKETQSELLYRGYPRASISFQDEPFIKEKAGVPSVTGDFHKVLLRCRLAVIDHPSTTLLIAMAANVPQLLFWDATHWPMTVEAEMMNQKLRSAGILHSSPESAAKKLNEIVADVPRWWRSDSVQSVREEFVQQYARCNKSWFVQWKKALTNL